MRVLVVCGLILGAGFRVEAQTSLEAPVLLYPENNEWFEPEDPFLFDCCWTFFWGSVDRANSYELQVYEDSLLSTLALPDTALADTLLNLYDAGWELELFRRYFWRVRALADTLGSPWSKSQSFVVYFPVSVEPRPAPPPTARLVVAYPNPATSRIVIRYETHENALIEIVVHDILGRKIETLSAGLRPSGKHETIWLPKDRATGLYVLRLRTGQTTDSKVIVLRGG